MSVNPVRIGLVGYGFGGRYFHAPLLAAADECDFLGVVTTADERRSQLAAEHPSAQVYDDLAALAAAGAEAVAISTPVATHVPLVQEALRLGLAVAVDKPFALDAAAARETVELAERLGVPLTVYQNRRWDSDFLTLRRLIDAGEIGDVTRFESRFERFVPAKGPSAAGGGSLRDFGSHLVDQALVLFGPARDVYARWHQRPDLDDRDDEFFVALTHVRGVRSHLSGSWVEGAPDLRFRVTGTTGSYVVDGVDGQEQALIDGRTPATDGDAWGAEPEDRWGFVQRGAERATVPSERGRWDTYYPAFARAVRGEGPLPVDPWDSVRALEVLDAARVSATTGDVVLLQS
jgi:predicted dehydrogenase